MSRPLPFALMGAGKVHIDVLTDLGAATGLALKGNCTKMSVKPDSELIEEYGASDTDLYQAIASAVVPKPTTAESEFNFLDADLFAMAFMGTNSALTQSAGSFADPGIDVVTIADKMVEVGKYKIAGAVVKNSAGTTTYVEGTDYEINSRVGGLTALSSGAIAAGETVKLIATYPEIAGTVMRGSTKSDIRCRILWEGKNMSDGREFIVELYRARLAPSTDFNFQNAIDKKFVRVGFKMTLEIPAGKTEAYRLIWLS